MLYWYTYTWWNCYDVYDSWRWKVSFTTNHALGVHMEDVSCPLHPMLLLMGIYTASPTSLSCSRRKVATVISPRRLQWRKPMKKCKRLRRRKVSQQLHRTQRQQHQRRNNKMLMLMPLPLRKRRSWSSWNNNIFNKRGASFLYVLNCIFLCDVSFGMVILASIMQPTSFRSRNWSSWIDWVVCGGFMWSFGKIIFLQKCDHVFHLTFFVNKLRHGIAV